MMIQLRLLRIKSEILGFDTSSILNKDNHTKNN